MFDKLFENLDDVAGKLGLPADQLKSVAEAFSGKMGQGGDQLSALMEAAQEHGLPVEKLQEMLGGMSGTEGLLGKVTEMFGGGNEGSPLDSLTDMAKGFFNKE